MLSKLSHAVRSAAPLAAVGSVGGILTSLLGQWSAVLPALFSFMGIDYAMGLIVAGIFHASPKSEDGRLESRAGLKGLFRKVSIALAVVAAAQADRALGTQFIRDAAAYAFMANELLSIVENLGLMGVPLGEPLTNAVSLLRQRAGEKGGTMDGGGTL